MKFNPPNSPGCYIMKDKSGTVIYIGKAKDLKKRVSNYFSNKELDSKTSELVKYIADIDFIATDTEVEALLLENTLIKKHKPKYNIDLKESRRYAYIQLTDETFPRLVTARSKDGKGKFFGPFVSGSEREISLRMLRHTLGIRTCNRLPKKACLKFHIGTCTAPCINNISKDEYDSNIKKAVKFLKGETGTLIENLKEEMQKYSAHKKYEQALIIRNQINALESLSQKQKIDTDKKYDQDIINYILDKEKIYLLLFNVHKGTIVNKKEFIIDNVQDAIESFIKMYYFENYIPQEIIAPCVVDPFIQNALTHIKEKKVTILVPKQGEKYELLELVKKNAEITFAKEEKTLKELMEKLKLNEIPNMIECFDISNLGQTNIVASMVQFRRGVADKSNYRRFKIKTVSGQDDFASMREVITRRYRRLKEENSELPDLIVIDGGKGQLTQAVHVLRDLGLKIPVIGLAKREEEIFVPGLSFPIILDKKSSGLRLLQHIRDEAHRFAVNYQRLLRSKSMVEE